VWRQCWTAPQHLLQRPAGDGPRGNRIMEFPVSWRSHTRGALTGCGFFNVLLTMLIVLMGDAGLFDGR